jgi:hypothetical protein
MTIVINDREGCEPWTWLAYLLTLADAKMLKRTPSQILADGANLAFFRRMQKELRA